MAIILKGKSIYLRLVNESDAEFICMLRNNDKLNQYISSSASDVFAQKQWINEYKIREAGGKEYYFIICRKLDQLPIGTVRMYDFKDDIKSFCWGSWILSSDKTKYAAIESALLIYQFGFEQLDFNQSHFDVMKGNDNVHSFHQRLGAKQISEDEVNIYYIFSKKDYLNIKQDYKKFLN